MTIEKDLEEIKGDSTLYTGMLAYLGDKEAAKYVEQCVDWVGQIWRYPEAQDKGDYINSCSRDMFMGALLGADQLTKLEIAGYLKFNNGLLCPKASDNRNRVGVMGWAQLGVALGEDATVSVMGLKGFLLAKLFRPLLGLISLLEALTVYEKYQINLVYCALMLYRRHGVAKWWEKTILKTIRNVRGQNDMVLNYLEGNYQYLAEEVPHMRNRRSWAVATGTPIKDWPLDTFDVNFPSAVFIRWCEKAAEASAIEHEIKQLLQK